MMFDIKDFAKRHFYVFLLLLLSLLFFHSLIGSGKIMSNIHYINDVTFYSYNVKESLKDGDLPLWTPYFYSGRPLFAQPEYHFIDINFLLILLTGNIYFAMNFSAITYLFIAGLGMYLLLNYLAKSRNAAFIAALLYMFNGFMHSFVVTGNIMIIEGYSLIPFIFLFVVKSLKEEKFAFNSILAGIFTALLIFAGGVIFIPYLFLLILVYSLIYVVGNNIRGRIIKLCLSLILIWAVSFGISAIKLFPDLEFTKLSNRGEGLPLQEYLGEPVNLANFVFLLVTNVFASGSSISAAIGIAGFALLILGLSRFKNRIILFSWIVILLSLLISSNSFLTKMLYHAPVFNQTRHVERALFLFAFASPILAGFGFLKFESLAEKHKNINKKIAISIIIILLLAELVFLQEFPKSQDIIKPNNIPILDYMGKDKSQFRTINQAMVTLIGASGYNYYSQLGISEIKGGGGIWFNDYLEYLIMAQNSPAKFWGILNNKYVVANSNLSIEGLKYLGKFKDCKNCAVWEAFGPYLYENKKYLPRYYAVSGAGLVVGDDATVRQIIYGLMLNGFDPKKTVLIQGKDINGYDLEFLKKFDFIILGSGSLDQSIGKLRAYADSGGIIAPNIFNGKNTIIQEDVDNIFNKTSSNYEEIKIEKYSNNKVALSLDGARGWLVASERFAYFPGWKATIDGKDAEIFKANNAVTAVYLDGNDTLVFKYKPKSYTSGFLISLLSAFAVLAYFGYYLVKKHKGGSNKA